MSESDESLAREIVRIVDSLDGDGHRVMLGDLVLKFFPAGSRGVAWVYASTVREQVAAALARVRDECEINIRERLKEWLFRHGVTPVEGEVMLDSVWREWHAALEGSTGVSSEIVAAVQHAISQHVGCAEARVRGERDGALRRKAWFVVERFTDARVHGFSRSDWDALDELRAALSAQTAGERDGTVREGGERVILHVQALARSRGASDEEIDALRDELRAALSAQTAGEEK